MTRTQMREQFARERRAADRMAAIAILSFGASIAFVIGMAF